MVATRFKMAASALLIAATGTAVARHVVHAPVVLRTAPRLPQTQAVFSGYVAAKKIPGVVGVIGAAMPRSRSLQRAGSVTNPVLRSPTRTACGASIR